MNSLGNLSQCMMDSDPEALARTRRQRRRAILISIVLEALLLAAMLLWPLVTPGILPHHYILTPIPPYGRHGGGNSRRQPHSNVHRPRIISDRIPHLEFPTPNARNRPRQFAEEAPPDLPPGLEGIPGPDSGAGPGLPFGFDNDRHGPIIERPHPASTSQPPVRQRISEGVMTGALIYRVEPAYPQIALAMGLSGTVRLRAIISTDGTIQHLEVLSGNPILARAAVNAVEHWRYRPTLLSGVPVEVETYISVNFVLSR
jgi:periplasmic protein TonB